MRDLLAYQAMGAGIVVVDSLCRHPADAGTGGGDAASLPDISAHPAELSKVPGYRTVYMGSGSSLVPDSY
jgi:hypothetical protein